jgi:predicted dinucleotide-binding enzyme
MRIGVIGAGNVGGTLGRAWVQNGHDVMFGVPNPTAPRMLELLRAIGSKAGAGSVAEAAAHGEVVVFATPWAATQDAVRQAGDLTGKVVLDCTDPLKEDLSGLAVGHTTSGAERVAAWASSQRVVKVFNTTGFENMAQPSYGGTAPRPCRLGLCPGPEPGGAAAARPSALALWQARCPRGPRRPPRSARWRAPGC